MLEGRVWPQKGQEIDSTGWARIEDRHIETDTERRKIIGRQGEGRITTEGKGQRDWKDKEMAR